MVKSNGIMVNISFTYEQEINRKISFFDILILRYGNSFETIVHCKSTHDEFLFTLSIICAKCMERGHT